MVRVRYARTSDGADIAFAVLGSGPPLLYARPLIRPPVDEALHEQMEPGALRLSATRSIIMWDHRGWGLSASAEPQFTLESSVLDLQAVADALSLGSFDLLAHLTPCHTAIAFAARNPDRVRRLVLRNPAPSGHSPRTTTFAGLPDIMGTHFREYVQLATLRVFGWDYAAGAKRWEQLLLQRFDAAKWERLMEEMERMDAGDEFPGVKAETLVLVDETALERVTVAPEDRKEYMRRLAAALPSAELAILKQSPDQTYAAVVEEFLRAGDASAAPPSGTAVILFADIVDSTGLTERIGDAAFRERARRLDGELRTIIRDGSGTPIDGKLLGDGVLATFVAASQAIDAALRCAAAGDAQGLPLHLGLHAGDIIREEDNVFGGAVNVASRVSALAAPGEVLVSDVVRALARTSAGVSFEDRGAHELKGIAEAQRLYAVKPA